MSIMSQGGMILFDGHDVTATSGYIYNSSNATSPTAGAVNSKYDYNLIQIGVPALAASILYYRIEGKFDAMDRWGEIGSGSVLATTDIDFFVSVTEKVKELRLGLKVGNSATPNTIYAGLCNVEVR